MIASAYDLGLRLIVEITTVPPGFTSVPHAATIAAGIGHVLEELHAGDDVEGGGRLGRERFGSDEPVVDARARFELVQLRDAKRLLAEVDADHGGASRRERFGQDAAAAADVDDTLARDAAGNLLDPVETQRIDLVQRPEHRALGIPPVMGERGELRELGGVDVGARRCGWGWARSHCRRSCQSARGSRSRPRRRS